MLERGDEGPVVAVGAVLLTLAFAEQEPGKDRSRLRATLALDTYRAGPVFFVAWAHGADARDTKRLRVAALC